VIELAKILALIAVLGTAVVYGTDVFCAVVQRPTLVVVDDRALVAVMGNVHHYGDRRMRVPGVLGGVAAIASAALFAVAGQWPQTITTVCAVAILLAWIVLCARISAPITVSSPRLLTASREQVRFMARWRRGNGDGDGDGDGRAFLALRT
jgi:hypothetical protein